MAEACRGRASSTGRWGLENARFGGNVAIYRRPAAISAPPAPHQIESAVGPQSIAAQAGVSVPAASRHEAASRWAPTLGFGLFVAGLVLAVYMFKKSGGPTYTPAVGVGAFSLFYVAAQSAERLTELILGVVDSWTKVPGLGKKSAVKARDEALVDAASASDEAKDEKETKAAEKQAEVDKVTTERTLVTFGLTALFGMALCAYADADFLTMLGMKFDLPGDTATRLLQETVQMAVTGLVVGGGSKALHDLISNLAKSSDAKSTPSETGGSK